MWTVARGHLSCDADADDAAQTVFTRLWANRKWRHIRHPRKYFRRAGEIAAKEFLRANSRGVAPDAADVAGLRDPGPGPDQELMLHRRDELLRRILEHLPPRCRSVMHHVCLRDLPRREAAKNLGVTVKAVENQVTRAYRLLRAKANSPDLQEWASYFEDGGG